MQNAKSSNLTGSKVAGPAGLKNESSHLTCVITPFTFSGEVACHIVLTAEAQPKEIVSSYY